jgi:hypothetical protein
MTSRWSYAAVAIVILMLAAAPLFQSRIHHDIALLERLAPRIERARMLAPETREAITALLERVRQSVSDARHEIRRQAAVDRVMAALNDKIAAPGSVGQRQAD